jgi:hypothetical protein
VLYFRLRKSLDDPFDFDVSAEPAMTDIVHEIPREIIGMSLELNQLPQVTRK